MTYKKCEIFNYIPHKKPYIKKCENHFEKWYEKYRDELIEMYEGTLGVINNKNISDVVIDIDSEKYFNIFINIVYNSSSKHINI